MFLSKNSQIVDKKSQKLDGRALLFFIILFYKSLLFPKPFTPKDKGEK